MTSKQGSLFGLAPIATKHESSASTQLAPYQPGRKLSRPEEKVVQELRVQRLVMEAQTVKTTFAMAQIGEIHEYANATFDYTLGEVFEVKERQPRSQEHQAYIDEFTTRQLSMFGRELLGAIDVGATNIAIEIHRALYPEPDPPQRRSLWQMLFG